MSDLKLKSTTASKMSIGSVSERKLVQMIELESTERAAAIAELQAEDEALWNDVNGVANAVNGANEGINMLDQIKADKDSLEEVKSNVITLQNETSDIGQSVSVMNFEIEALSEQKADATHIFTYESSNYTFDFYTRYNCEMRLLISVVESISFNFGNGEYPADYVSGLSFDSGATPTAIDYTGSRILNWVGTDCATVDGLSIFQPSANTHYDIVFYFNGVQFIGLVNGFVPALGNEVTA